MSKTALISEIEHKIEALQPADQPFVFTQTRDWISLILYFAVTAVLRAYRWKHSTESLKKLFQSKSQEGVDALQFLKIAQLV